MEDNDQPEECKVCVTQYDRAKRRPRTLPCGHTFCSLCLAGMVQEAKEANLACPSCRMQHAAAHLDYFPISYDMEAVIRKLRMLQFMAAGGTGSFPLLQERQEAVAKTLASMKDTASQLERYEGQLEEWRTEHEELTTRLQDLLERHRVAIKLLHDESSIVLYQKKKGEEALQRLADLSAALTTADNARDAIWALDESETQNSEAGDWVDHCRAILPDTSTVQASLKVREETRGALQQRQAGGGCNQQEGGTQADHDPTASIMDKVNLLATPMLSVDHLRRVVGRVRAVRRLADGSCRHASVTLHDGRLLLHALTDKSTQAPARTIEHETLLNCLDPTSTLTWLELRWPGGGGHVFVSVSPAASWLARQFVLLCTGQRGPCYSGSSLLAVWNRGTDLEMVAAGDYDRGDGTGGTQLLTEREVAEAGAASHRRRAAAGTVRAPQAQLPSRSAQFAIATRHCPEREWHWSFGQVEGGLEVVQEVATLACIKQVIIHDCGVVLPI